MNPVTLGNTNTSGVCDQNACDDGAGGGERIRLMGVPADNVTMQQAIATLLERTAAPGPTQVCFVNADCVNVARRDAEYSAVLEESDLNYLDGVGMRLAGRALGVRVVDNVNGTDMFPPLCAAMSEAGKRLYLLGARPGVAAEVARWVAEHHPGVVVCGVRDGYFSPDEEPEVIAQVARARADVLLVAFGAPRQEKWIRRHLSALDAKVAIGVGGLFDFYSGRIPRAPLWMRRCGLEWVWRWRQEPRRLLRRYLFGNPLFLLRVLGAACRRRL